VARDSCVKAVVLRINTPGGGVTASDIMCRDLVEFKQRTGKPVIACLMDVAAGGGYFLRLSLPERHAGHIKLGDDVIVGSRGMTELSADAPLGHGKVVKVYPEIDNGNVLADVEVADLGDFFVGERTRVWIPVAMKTVVSVPVAAITTRAGVDYVKLADGTDVPVIIGQRFDDKGTPAVEILSGLAAGDTVVTP